VSGSGLAHSRARSEIGRVAQPRSLSGPGNWKKEAGRQRERPEGMGMGSHQFALSIGLMVGGPQMAGTRPLLGSSAGSPQRRDRTGDPC
jgi:hypothetical protein